MAIPAFFIDNVTVIKSGTVVVRGNRVTNLKSNTASVTGIYIANCKSLRAYRNQASTLSAKPDIDPFRDQEVSIGMQLVSCGLLSKGVQGTAILVYNTQTRCDFGLVAGSRSNLPNIYNNTTYNCNTHLSLGSDTELKNISMSNAEEHRSFNAGVAINALGTVSIDNFIKYGVANFDPDITQGENAYTEKPLFIDEKNENFTPDYVSPVINKGVANPLQTTYVDIGGVTTKITTEDTVQPDYQWDLLDNTFWDVDNEDSVEMAFIRTLQSRVVGANQAALFSAVRDYKLLEADSNLGFSEVFPTYSVYANESRTKKRVQDLWFAATNPGTIQALQNAIGGYNRYPSFFRRLEDRPNAWVIGDSTLGVDNVLLGQDGLRYGIQIEVLGTNTLSTSASGEAYDLVQNSVADLAPTHWFLRDEAQPENYIMFAEDYNGLENSTLNNMRFNDDNGIEPQGTGSCSLISPPISTTTSPVSGSTITVAASGYELSVLDRLYNPEVSRKVYYRKGDSAAEVTSSNWTEVTYHIGELLTLDKQFIQFRVTLQDVENTYDYEFVSLALRPYQAKRNWPSGFRLLA